MTFEELPVNIEIALVRITELDNKLNAIMNLLDSKNEKSQTDQRFSVKSLAEYLECSITTINRYVKDDMITYHRLNRTLYFLKSEIDQESSSRSTKYRLAC